MKTIKYIVLGILLSVAISCTIEDEDFQIRETEVVKKIIKSDDVTTPSSSNDGIEDVLEPDDD